MQGVGEDVDVVVAEYRLDPGQVVLIDGIGIIELVTVDESFQALDRPADPVHWGFACQLGPVPARHEAGGHRPECPDRKSQLHLKPLRFVRDLAAQRGPGVYACRTLATQRPGSGSRSLTTPPPATS